MERLYETVCIINPDIGETAIKALVGKISSVIEANKGKNIELTEWGRRKLAYSIEKKKEGYYAIFKYKSPSDAGAELERTLRYTEDVLRYQTVVLEGIFAPVAPAAAAPVAAAPSADKGGANA